MTISTLAVGAGMLLASATNIFAYRGDPSVQGPDCTEERHAVMTQAFENNDYNAWRENMQGRGRVTEVVNEGNFAVFSEMHQLMLEGKTEEANAIRAELGLGQKNGSGQGKGQGMGYGKNTNR